MRIVIYKVFYNKIPKIHINVKYLEAIQNENTGMLQKETTTCNQEPYFVGPLQNLLKLKDLCNGEFEAVHLKHTTFVVSG